MKTDREKLIAIIREWNAVNIPNNADLAVHLADFLISNGVKIPGVESMDRVGWQTISAHAEKGKKMEIKDSGRRREFETGAVRDIQEGKGRCDLLPLEMVEWFIGADNEVDPIISSVNEFKETGNPLHLYDALEYFCNVRGYNRETMLLEVAKHFEAGAAKYGEHNWQKGIPVHCYIDSGLRHYLKWLRGDNDEPHDRAFVWNMLCCIWTVYHYPALDDFTVKKDGNI